MKILLIILFVAFHQITFGQRSKKEIFPPVSPEKTNRTKYSLKQRLSFFPFNLTTQIKIVSFDKRLDSSLSNPDNPFIYELPLKADSICSDKISETIALNLYQIDTITDILYNTCYRWTIYETSKNGCYKPHNAILFYDKNDKLLAYIELCFDCNRIKYSDDKIVQFDDCNNAIDDLRKYFKKLGLKTGEEDFINPNSTKQRVLK